LEKQISSLSRRDATLSSTTGRDEIIDERFWVSHDYQRLGSKIGRAGRLLALLGLPLSSNAEEWLRLRLRAGAASPAGGSFAASRPLGGSPRILPEQGNELRDASVGNGRS
jgi:hypothetical protein